MWSAKSMGNALLPRGRQNHIHRVVHCHDTEQRPLLIHDGQRNQVIFRDDTSSITRAIGGMSHPPLPLPDTPQRRARVPEEEIPQVHTAPPTSLGTPREETT